MYQELADMACERITAAITRAERGANPVKAVLDPIQSRRLDAPRSFRHYQDDALENGAASLSHQLGRL